MCKNKPGKATNLSDKNCQLHDCKERGQAKVFVAQKLKAVDRLMSPAIRATVGGGPTRVRPEPELKPLGLFWLKMHCFHTKKKNSSKPYEEARKEG